MKTGAAPVRLSLLGRFGAAAVMALGVLLGPAAAAQIEDVTRLRAFSTASGHAPVSYGAAGEASAILIDDAVLRQPVVPAGLRVAVAQKDGLARAAFFRLSDRVGEVERLEQFIGAVLPGEAVVMTVHRTMAPVDSSAGIGDAEVARLASLLASLGAEAAPVGCHGASWAFVALRQGVNGASGGDWVRLAESVSGERGVSLSFVLASDRRLYEGYASQLVADGPRRVRLLERWPTLETMADTAIFEAIEIGGRSMPAVLAHPPYGKDALAQYPHGENRLVFRGVALGASPRLECSIGMGEGAHGNSDGVVFSVAVDGRVIATRALTAAAEQPPAWHEWVVDLGEYRGRVVDLELRTAPNENTLYDHAYWGEPVIGDGEAAVAASAANVGEHRVAFIGHAYPMNGFDKRTLGSYLGWSPSDESYMAQGASLRRRIGVENWGPARTAFFDALRAVGAERVIWGGDTMYLPGEDQAAHLGKLLGSISGGHVVLPGNHDFPLAADAGVLERCAAAAGADETIAGVRLVYVDTIQSGGKIIVDDASACDPDEAWVEGLKARLSAAGADGQTWGVIVAMHHAPWLTKAGVANVAHADRWWEREVHPSLRVLAESGVDVVVLAGDGGDHCMADGREVEGVRYIVTGQPRFDSGVINGFVEVGWGPSRPGLVVRVHGWEWGREPRVWEAGRGAWRY